MTASGNLGVPSHEPLKSPHLWDQDGFPHPSFGHAEDGQCHMSGRGQAAATRRESTWKISMTAYFLTESLKGGEAIIRKNGKV